jgi:DNA-binding transcriptional LysR family regulator
LPRRFTERHPRVGVRLVEGFDRDVRDRLRRGTAEAGVVTLPAPGLDTVDPGGDGMVAVLPEGHRSAGGSPVEAAGFAVRKPVAEDGARQHAGGHADP